MVTAMWSVSKRTGTSNSKPAVTSTPKAGSMLKVTSQPESCSTLCQHAVADELQHLTPEGVHRPGDAVEPGVEGGDHRSGLRRLGQGGEVAQIGIEQRGADGLSGAAAQRAGLHPGGTAPAEIGLEQRCQRRPRGQDG